MALTTRRLSEKLFTVIALSWLLGNPLLADETVKLKNGQTYAVPMEDGFPKLFEDEHIRVKSLAPLQGMNPKESRLDCAWCLAARVKKEGDFKLSIRCLLDDSLKEERSFKGPGMLNESVFSRSHFPSAWSWLEDSDTSYIPFAIRFEAAKAQDSFEFIQWVKYDDDAKDDLSDNMPKLETVTLKDGRSFQVPTYEDEPLNFDSSLVTLDSFGVRSRKSKETGKTILLWGFTGSLRAKGHFKMVISTPLDPLLTGTMDLNGPGKITASYFSQEQCPGLWAWLEDSGVTWIPFKIRFEADSPQDSFEFMQWHRLDSKGKKRMRKLLEKENATGK